MSVTPDPLVVLDSVTRVAPLGVRFWDVVLARPPQHQLAVTAYSPSTPRQRTPAAINPSGIYIVQNVPALRVVESGRGDADYWAGVTQSPFVLEVIDPQQRFLSFTFTARLPERGLFTWTCGPAAPPPEPGLAVPLYSTPSRTFPAELALVRAELFDPQANTPAAWAVLEVSLGGQLLGRGIADSDGRVALAFDYPEPIDYLPDSPMDSGRPLTEQQWTVQLTARYAPPASAPSAPGLPDLCATLEQTPGSLWQRWNPPAGNTPLTEAVLAFSRPLVLRSQDAGGAPLSVLFLTP